MEAISFKSGGHGPTDPRTLTRAARDYVECANSAGPLQPCWKVGFMERIHNSYVSRMVNQTTLAPDIVAAILDDTLPNHVTLFDRAVDPPALWDEQRERLCL